MYICIYRGQDSDSDDGGSLFASASETESVMTEASVLSHNNKAVVGERLAFDRGVVSGGEAYARTDDMKVLWPLHGTYTCKGAYTCKGTYTCTYIYKYKYI